MKFNFYSFITFYFLYSLSEWFIQSNMYFPQYLRHHLSDVFAGPTILYIVTLYPLILIKEKWDLNRNIYLLSPVFNLILCIFWELKIDKHSDIVDIYCYIGGTILYYLTCINYKNMYYNFKIFKLNIEVQLSNTFYDNQLEILPRITILHGNMKLIAFSWIYFNIDIEFYKS